MVPRIQCGIGLPTAMRNPVRYERPPRAWISLAKQTAATRRLANRSESMDRCSNTVVHDCPRLFGWYIVSTVSLHHHGSYIGSICLLAVQRHLSSIPSLGHHKAPNDERTREFMRLEASQRPCAPQVVHGSIRWLRRHFFTPYFGLDVWTH